MLQIAAIQDGRLMGAGQSASQNKRVKGAKLSGTKIICIIIKTIAYQSRPYEYQLDNLRNSQARININ